MGRWLKKISETGGVPTDKADKGGSVSLVSTLPPHIQKTQVIDQVTRQLKADRHMVLALLSDDDQEQIGEGLITANQLADYLNAMKADRKPLVDPQWHLDRLMEQVDNRRRQNAHDTAEWRECWKAAHELFINHVMDCTACRPPQRRYCDEGAKLWRVYREAHQSVRS